VLLIPKVSVELELVKKKTRGTANEKHMGYGKNILPKDFLDILLAVA